MSVGDEPWKDPGWRAPLLAVGAAAFGAVARLRGAAYGRGLLPVERVRCPVISVGNLAVGGRGKTPFTILLAQRLTKEGLRVAVLSRGYGREVAQKDPPLIVSEGAGPLLSAQLGGDEPVLIARRTSAAVVVCGSRARAAQVAIQTLGAQILVLDDGFQHRQLARDLDIVLLDGQQPLANGRLLPAGPLREPPSALERADLLVLNRGGAAESAVTTGLLADKPLLEVEVVASGLGPLDGAVAAPSALSGRPVALLSAIARPHRFVRTVQSLGAKVTHQAHFSDHHRFSAQELEAFFSQAQASGAQLVVTTEKDAVRLPKAAELPMDVHCLFVEHRVVEGAPLLEGALRPLVERACATS